MRRSLLNRAVSALLVVLLADAGLFADPRPQGQQPLGVLRAQGEVYVNGAPLTGESTVFAGDTLRTGPLGSAGLTLTARGALVLAANTEISLASAPRYFASLRQGTITFRTLAGARNAQVEVSQFIVVPATEAEVSAEMFRAADGSARITGMAGSVGVLALEGEASVFLRPGQTAQISAQGKLVAGAAPPVSQPPGPAPAPPAAGGSRTALILVAVAGGGAAAALVALAGKKKDSQAVSPSAP